MGFWGNDAINYLDALGDKILNIDFFESGDSVMEADGAAYWASSLGRPYLSIDDHDKLGFESGFGYDYPSVFSPLKGAKQACALYKWEAVARWLVPADYTSIPVWECTASQVRIEQVANGKRTSIWSRQGPFYDGPTGRAVGPDTTGHGQCGIVKQYAYDAPRYAAAAGQGKSYYFFGKFELKISDSENARALSFVISFFFDDQNPAMGVGGLTITEQDHEVPR
jgi:hypothetical protein